MSITFLLSCCWKRLKVTPSLSYLGSFLFDVVLYIFALRSLILIDFFIFSVPPIIGFFYYFLADENGVVELLMVRVATTIFLLLEALVGLPVVNSNSFPTDLFLILLVVLSPGFTGVEIKLLDVRAEILILAVLG